MSPQFCYTSHDTSPPRDLKTAYFLPCTLLSRIRSCGQKNSHWSFYLLPPSPTPLHLVLGKSLCPVQLASSGTKLDWYRSKRTVPMIDVYLCVGEEHPRQAPFPPFIRLCSFILPSVFPVLEMMLGICDLGHSGRNWPAQGRPCVCLLAMQRSAANSLLLPSLSMGESKCGPGCVGDTKK